MTIRIQMTPTQGFVLAMNELVKPVVDETLIPNKLLDLYTWSKDGGITKLETDDEKKSPVFEIFANHGSRLHVLWLASLTKHDLGKEQIFEEIHLVEVHGAPVHEAYRDGKRLKLSL